MELGLTFPLQRTLGCAPAHGADPFHPHCWDCHVICLRGHKSLLAVHCMSRWTAVLYAPSAAQWQDPAAALLAGIENSLLSAGFPPADVRAFLGCAPPARFTRTHGRRAVAHLNRAWEAVLRQEYALDPCVCFQPLLEHAVNNALCRCAGFDGSDSPLSRMAHCIKEYAP